MTKGTCNRCTAEPGDGLNILSMGIAMGTEMSRTATRKIQLQEKGKQAKSGVVESCWAKSLRQTDSSERIAGYKISWST